MTGDARGCVPTHPTVPLEYPPLARRARLPPRGNPPALATLLGCASPLVPPPWPLHPMRPPCPMQFYNRIHSCILFTLHNYNKFVKNTEKELASRGCRRSLMRTPLPELRAAGDSSLDGSRSWRNLESTGGGNNSHGKYHTEKNRFSMSGMGFSKRASGRSEERIGFRKCAVFELTTYVSLSVHKR